MKIRGREGIDQFFLFKFLYSMTLEKGKGQKVRNRQSTTEAREVLLISHIDLFISIFYYLVFLYKHHVS